MILVNMYTERKVVYNFFDRSDDISTHEYLDGNGMYDFLDGLVHMDTKMKVVPLYTCTNTLVKLVHMHT